MQQIERTGKSVEEAVAAALQELRAQRDEVEVEVLSESGRGLLGIFGQTEARVRVTRTTTTGQRALDLVQRMLSLLEISAKVGLGREDEESVELEIDAGDDTGLVIGRRGETLGALQHLAALLVNRGQPQGKRLLLNAGGYLERREQALLTLAQRTAQKVRASGRPVTLEALSPRERRIIHVALADEPGVATASIGAEPNRRVVVSPSGETARPHRDRSPEPSEAQAPQGEQAPEEVE